MKSRWQHWIVWLLPFLVARALVPVGFMLSVGDRGLELTFCPSAAPTVQIAATEAPIAHHEHHHDSEDTQTDRQQHSDHYRASDTGTCPFGLGGAACAGSPLYASATFVAPATDLLPTYSPPPDSHRLVRIDRIRGPPTASLT